MRSTAATTPREEQRAELERVSERLDDLILEFCAVGRQFHMEELHRFIAARTAAAPGSPDRILRALRQARRLNYRVVSRSASLYEVLPIEEVRAAATFDERGQGLLALEGCA